MKRFLLSILNGERNDGVAVLVRIPLLLVSIFYGFAVKCILLGYQYGWFKKRKLPVPVVSIGNLTVGGVGKTPMCIFLAKMLTARNVKPLVLTRGYSPGLCKEELGESDEVQLLREALGDVPVVSGSNRYKSGLMAMAEYKPEVVLLDDGFQHWKLYRDLDILLIDCTNPFGNGFLLPAGILREYSTAISRAGLIILTKADRGNVLELRKQIDLFYSGISIAEAVHRPVSLTDIFTSQEIPLKKIQAPVVGFCGIGDPLSFKALLISVGSDVKEFIPYMDHHDYQINDMIKIRKHCEHVGVKTIVTTKKDAVKLMAFKDLWLGYNLYSLNIQIEITKGLDEIRRKLDHLLLR